MMVETKEEAEKDPLVTHMARHEAVTPYQRLGMAIIEQFVNDVRVAFLPNGESAMYPAGKGKNPGFSMEKFREQCVRDLVSSPIAYWCDHVGLNIEYFRKKVLLIMEGLGERPGRLSPTRYSRTTRAYVRRLPL